MNCWQNVVTFARVDDATCPAMVGIPFDVDTQLGACGSGARIGM